MVESQEGEVKGNIEIFEFFLADAMKKEYIEHYSNSLGKQMHICIYGFQRRIQIATIMRILESFTIWVILLNRGAFK